MGQILLGVGLTVLLLAFIWAMTIIITDLWKDMNS